MKPSTQTFSSFCKGILYLKVAYKIEPKAPMKNPVVIAKITTAVKKAPTTPLVAISPEQKITEKIPTNNNSKGMIKLIISESIVSSVEDDASSIINLSCTPYN